VFISNSNHSFLANEKIIVTTALLLAACFSFAQLKIYQNLNLQGSSGTCLVNTVYSGTSIPGSLNDAFNSIALDSGYQAVLAENTDGTGVRLTCMATQSALKLNLSSLLQNKVSFIRVLKLPNTKVKKKGAAQTAANWQLANALNCTWGYSWGLNAIVPSTREFTPMAWGSSGASDTNLDSVLRKDSITQYLAFNEPDNSGQANMFVNKAVPLYKK